MSDPMDVYSKPVKTEKHKLCTQYFMVPRADPRKPGRELLVTYDDRFPFVEGFVAHYSYLVRFLEEGNFAGNHYHEKKHELFVPVVGEFTIDLEHIETKERESVGVRSDENSVLYIHPLVAHKVTTKTKNGVLLVIATSPNSDEDEYKYEVGKIG